MTARVKRAHKYASVALAILGLLSIGLFVWLGWFGGARQVAEYGQLIIESTSSHWQIVVFIVLASISLWLIIPSGSLLLIGAGFALGAASASLIYYLLHCFFCWPAYQLAKQGMPAIAGKEPNLARQRPVPDNWQATMLSLQKEPFLASVALRLIPVIPNAAACIAAPLLGISFGSFFLATVLTCWIRPLFYASIGAGLSELSELHNPEVLVAQIDRLPIIVLALSAIALLLARIYLASRKIPEDIDTAGLKRKPLK